MLATHKACGESFDNSHRRMFCLTRGISCRARRGRLSIWRMPPCFELFLWLPPCGGNLKEGEGLRLISDLDCWRQRRGEEIIECHKALVKLQSAGLARPFFSSFPPTFCS